MQLNDKKILVTGSDGFIGSHLVESLIARGYEVRAFIFYNSFNSWGWLDTLSNEQKKKIEVFAGDIRDMSCVRAAMKDCDIVFHLAALIAIPYSYLAPDAYVDTNIKGTLNVLQAARDVGVKKVIHTSTSEVYGSAQFVPITEEHPLQGQSPYSASKIGADQMALAFHRSFELPVAIVRPFNTYGPRQSARAVIPTIITQLAKGERQIKLGSIHTTRDFNFVDDTVKGFLRAAESDTSIGEVINIGGGFEISIADTARLIAELMNIPLEVITENARKRPQDSEVERLCADNKKARGLIDWQPNYAGKEGLMAGLEKTIAWFSEPDNLCHYKSHLYNV